MGQLMSVEMYMTIRVDAFWASAFFSFFLIISIHTSTSVGISERGMCSFSAYEKRSFAQRMNENSTCESVYYA